MKITSIKSCPHTASGMKDDTTNKFLVKQESTPVNDIFNEDSFSNTQPLLQKKEISEDQLVYAIEKANESFVGKYTRFEFSIHDDTKAIMVKVYDQNSNELIREIPPEKILDMVATIWELAGIIVDGKV